MPLRTDPNSPLVSFTDTGSLGFRMLTDDDRGQIGCTVSNRLLADLAHDDLDVAGRAACFRQYRSEIEQAASRLYDARQWPVSVTKDTFNQSDIAA